ncbi:MAG: hypothetical protein L0219_02305 [Phycisphaerales bacterium]|nr:hypothetical protein [Phycisphaerales bacterium]
MALFIMALRFAPKLIEAIKSLAESWSQMANAIAELNTMICDWRREWREKVAEASKQLDRIEQQRNRAA